MDLQTDFSFFPSSHQQSLQDDDDIHNPINSRTTHSRVDPLRSTAAHHPHSNDANDSSDTTSVDENLEIESVASSVEDKLSCRGRLQIYIHCLPAQIVVLSLVVLDALIVLAELLLDVGAFNNRECQGENEIEQADFCHYQSRFRSQCPPSPIILNKGENLTAGNGSEFCICAYKLGKYTCVSVPINELSPGLDPAIVLHYTSVAILTVFLVEIILKIFAFRLKYFTHKFEVFDGIVVLIAWILDVASSIQEDAFFEISTLIIILRLWRVVRIVNGGVLSAKTRSDKQLQQARAHSRNIVHALHKAQKKIVEQDKELQRLNQFMDKQNLQTPDDETREGIRIPEYPYDKEEGIHFIK